MVEGVQQYYDQQQGMLEDTLVDAVDACIAQQSEAPCSFIGRMLLDAGGTTEAGRACSPDVQALLRRAVGRAARAEEQAGKSGSDYTEEWSVEHDAGATGASLRNQSGTTLRTGMSARGAPRKLRGALDRRSWTHLQ